MDSYYDYRDRQRPYGRHEDSVRGSLTLHEDETHF